MGPQRELTKATRELGEVRMTVCKSTLASDSGEMERARFLLNFRMERGVAKREPGWKERSDRQRERERERERSREREREREIEHE